MSIFTNQAHTAKVVSPFIWNDTYLKVHPNGAAVFAEDKKLAFLLPLIIEAHNLLPPTPLFWTNDDKTIPLHRQTLWLHANTIQWLSDTGEAYPQELREVIQPRLQKMKPPPPAKAMQPPPPPKPSRWQQKSDAQASQGSTSQDPKVAQPSPHQLAEHEKRYMELQAVVANLGQRTLRRVGRRPINLVRNQMKPRPRPHPRGWMQGPTCRLAQRKTGPPRSVHRRWPRCDQNHRHRHRLPRNQRRMPRVPASYPHVPQTT